MESRSLASLPITMVRCFSVESLVPLSSKMRLHDSEEEIKNWLSVGYGSLAAPSFGDRDIPVIGFLYDMLRSVCT